MTIRPGSVLLLGLFALGGIIGCGSPPRPVTEVLERSPRLPDVFQSGLAIPPTANLLPVPNSADVAARFSNALHIEALTQLRGVEILSPEFVLEGLARGGDQALNNFRDVRRAMARGESPSAQEL